MLSDVMKLAMRRLTREAYLGIDLDGKPSPLYGCRFPAVMHDEPLSELIRKTAHLSGPRVAEVMMDAGRYIAPQVTWKAETAISYYLDKAMEPVYRDGMLVPWEAAA
jgi:hypothetical protein